MRGDAARRRLGIAAALGGLAAASAAALTAAVSPAAAAAPTCATVAPSVIQAALGVEVTSGLLLNPGRAKEAEARGGTDFQCLYPATGVTTGSLGAAILKSGSSVAITYDAPATQAAWRSRLAALEDPYASLCRIAGLDCQKKGLTLKPLTGIGTDSYWTQTGQHSSDTYTDIWVLLEGRTIFTLSVPSKNLEHAEALARTITRLVS